MNRQTRIFVPLTTPFDRDNWAETVFGRIIKPVVENNDALKLYWFSRYNCPASMDAGDCDITQIPPEFMNPQNQHYRSIRFRYSIDNNHLENFEQQCRNLIQENNCCISDFRDYDIVGDLGSNRHLGGDRTQDRRTQRAELIGNLYWSICRLVLDNLIAPDAQGRYSFEHNDSNEIVFKSSFETPHHLFCNITEVPLRVLVSQIAIGTDVAPPQNPMQAVRVKF